MTGRLLEANQRYLAGSTGALQEIGSILKKLSDFYPVHILKEDKDFFRPCMKYFDTRELEIMLDEFYEFDRKLIHLKYQEITERFRRWESGRLF